MALIRIYNKDTGNFDIYFNSNDIPNLENYYTKNEIDIMLENLVVDVDLSNYYTKPQIDNFLNNKLNLSDVYDWAKQPTKPTYTYSEVGAAASSHVHTMNQITNLNETILNLAKKVHTHAITDITDLQTTLNNKANTNHTHSQYLTSEDIPDSISDFISNTPSDGSFLAFSTGAGWMAINLTSNLIPDLPASKITSGTFNASRIPSLSADKITSGIFSISRIPTGTTESTVALGNHTHSNYVTTSGTAYDSTRWNGYRIRTGSGLSGLSGYITFSY